MWTYFFFGEGGHSIHYRMILCPSFHEWWVERGLHTPLILSFSFIFVMMNASSQQPAAGTWERKRKERQMAERDRQSLLFL